MVAAVPAGAYADDNDLPRFSNGPISEESGAKTGGTQVVISDSWERVWPPATNNLTNPINGQVHIETYNYGSTHVDIRMCGASGNVVWSECCAIDCNESRTFYCGSDVYYIEAKTHWWGINWTNKGALLIITAY